MVRFLGGTWIVSVDDVWRFDQCPQSFLNAVDVARGIGQSPPRRAEPLRAMMGLVLDDHRERIVTDVSSRSDHTVTIAPTTGPGIGPDQLLGRLDSSHRSTLDALNDHAKVVISPVFAEPDSLSGGTDIVWTGSVDVITRSPALAPAVDQSEPGWELWEARLGASQTGRTLFRLAAFTDFLTRTGHPTTNRVRILFANSPDSLRGIQRSVEQWIEAKGRLEGVLESHLKKDSPLVWPTADPPSCGRKSCDWCSGALRHHDDIFRLPGITSLQRLALNNAGIPTVTSLALASRRELASRVTGIEPDLLSKLHTQATLSHLAAQDPESPPPFEVVNPRALDVLPQPDPADLFLDFEADPGFRVWTAKDPYFPTPRAADPRWWLGLDYLAGIATRATSPSGENFLALWSENFDEEEHHFRLLLEDITSLRHTAPSAHVYHYAPYEMVALHRMARRYGHGASLLSDWEREGVFVDLHRILTRSILAGVPNYSLKSVERLFLPATSRGEVADGAGSVAAIRDYWKARHQTEGAVAEALKSSIISYNLQDTLSTRDLADWLATRAQTV